MNISCPKCGKALQPVALGPSTAPWVCFGCARGFFAAELTAEARALYRPHHDDWGLGTAKIPLMAAVELEIADARARGTSLREDQFVHTPTDVLTTLAKRNINVTFKALLEAHLKNVGA